jgi:putative RecB family exonuclease
MGRFVHYILENIFALPAHERVAERTNDYLDLATSTILTDDVRADLGLTESQQASFVREGDKIAKNYFTMEDATTRNVEGIEQRLNVEINGVPLVGILDRLDREDDGSLTIVDYKTGRAPNPNYLSSVFANTELYAAMCEEALKETPERIRLFYVGAGEIVERPVTAVVVDARRKAAATAWSNITSYYADGHFPARPSSNTCRFCAYKSVCRDAGVAVPD